MLRELLQKLAADLGDDFQTAVKEEKEGLSYQLEPDLTLFFKELKPGVAIWTKVGEMPQMRKEEFFSHVMHGNLLGQGTGGATLGMTQDEKFLTLSWIIDYEINQADFKDKIEDIANFTHFWRGELARFIKESEDSVIT